MITFKQFEESILSYYQDLKKPFTKILHNYINDLLLSEVENIDLIEHKVNYIDSIRLCAKLLKVSNVIIFYYFRLYTIYIYI